MQTEKKIQCSHRESNLRPLGLLQGWLYMHIQGAAEQIKRFERVNTRAVVGVGWCTWSPSALSVTPWFGPEHIVALLFVCILKTIYQ
jgi:hypothetical protein